jgi:hypothetical protein
MKKFFPEKSQKISSIFCGLQKNNGEGGGHTWTTGNFWGLLG